MCMMYCKQLLEQISPARTGNRGVLSDCIFSQIHGANAVKTNLVDLSHCR